MPENELMTIAVLDDDAGALNIISASVSSLLKQANINHTIETFSSPETFLASKKDYELFFCDIELPFEKGDGIQVSEAYLKKNPNSTIVFVSNREDKVFDSLKVHPFGFIRKKNFLEDISFLLRSYLAKRKEAEEEPTILLSFNTNFYKVKMKDIIYIESNKKTQYVHIDKKEDPIIITSTMKELEEKLSPYGFLLTHKAFLVNYKFIKDIDNELLIHLSNGEKVFLAKRKVSEVKQKYLELVQNETKLIF